MEQMSNIPKEKVYRYLGYDRQKHNLTKEMDKLVDQCISSIIEISQLRTIYSNPISLTRENGIIYAGNIPLLGNDINRHLEHCSQSLFIAVTLGTAVDALIRKYETIDIAKAVILEAVANVVIEELADTLENKLRVEYRKKGLYLTIRYSPGYGDFPLSFQKEILDFLDAYRKIGLSVTPNYIMIPRKSITAVLGISNFNVKGKLAGCNQCVLKEKCNYRKRGMTCES